MLIVNDLRLAAPAPRKCLRCNGLRLFLIHSVKVSIFGRLAIVVLVLVLVEPLVARLIVVVIVVVRITPVRAFSIFVSTARIIFASHN